MTTYLPLTIFTAGLIVTVAATVAVLTQPIDRSRRAAAQVKHRHVRSRNERVADTAEIERLTMDKLRGRGHLTHAWGQIPRAMPAGAPPWPVMTAVAGQLIQLHAPAGRPSDKQLTPAEATEVIDGIEAARAELATVFTGPQPVPLPAPVTAGAPHIAPDVPGDQGGCAVCGDDGHHTEGHDAVFSIIAPPGEPDSHPAACSCGRPAGHLGDALAHGSADDIAREMSTGTFQAVTDA